MVRIAITWIYVFIWATHHDILAAGQYRFRGLTRGDHVVIVDIDGPCHSAPHACFSSSNRPVSNGAWLAFR